MAEAAKMPVKTESGNKATPVARREWEPFESLRREVDRLFDDFTRGFPFGGSFFDIEPFWRRTAGWGAMPAMDVVDKGKAYEITAELPGLDENDVEIKLSDDTLTIQGEKKEETEEKKKDYYLAERRYGSFQRSFRLPASVDADRIEASFRKGVLTVTLPKKPEAVKAEKKIPVSAK
ncbi:MAG: Hsp20/alpha crystallin family protein [Rhodospirillaceae bacterium]|nr:Hsp20/alpha crystallin family protein [Rhodospirillaceae bacterium]